RSSITDLNNRILSDTTCSLYEQGMDAVEGGFTSQFFPVFNGRVYAADDFVVPADAQWDVVQIIAPGTKNEDAIREVAITFFDNSADNLPNKIIYEDTITRPVADHEDANLMITLDPSRPLELSPGTYWVSLTPVLRFNGRRGRWFHARTPCSSDDEPFYWRDVSNIFGTGRTQWTPATEFSPTNCKLAFSVIANDLNDVTPCFGANDVSDRGPSIPTIGEWGIIILALSLIIMTMIAYKMIEEDRSSVTS
ncbi:MAG: hypothetical protein AAFQ02_07425, partial [Bacteroidota bacterium]